MGLEEMLDSIDRETRVRVEGLGKRAREESEGIVGAAEAEAKRLLAESVSKAKAEGEGEMRRALASKSMELKRRYHNALNEIISDSIARIYESVDDFRASETYAKLMPLLYKRVIGALGADCIIRMRAEDARLLGERIGDRLRDDDGVRAGMIGVSRDGLREVDYSFKSIIDMVENDLSGSLSEMVLH